MILLKMAFRNLWRQKRRTVLTLLAIIFAEFLLGMVISIQDGTYGNMIELFTKAYTGHVTIAAKGYHDAPTLRKTVGGLAKIEEILGSEAGLTGFSRKINFSALVFAEKRTTGVQVVGVDYPRGSGEESLARQVTRGTYQSLGGNRALLGATAAKILRVEPGNEVALVGQDSEGAVATELFTVVGIVGDDAAGMAGTKLFIDFSDAQRFASLQGRAHEISLIYNSHQESASASKRVSTALQRAGLIDVEARPWFEVQKAFYLTMKADRESSVLTMQIVAAMAALVVLNTVLMMLLERTREFGILSAIGTRPIRLFAGIMLETSMLASLGVLGGLLLTLVLVLIMSRWGIPIGRGVNVAGVVMERMYAAPEAECFWRPALLVFVATVVIAAWPAWKAARRSPIDAMRHA